MKRPIEGPAITQPTRPFVRREMMTTHSVKQACTPI